MTRFEASTPAERRGLVAEAVMAHRTRDSDRAVFESGDEEPARVTFADGAIELSVSGAERDRLAALLEEFPVFKLARSESREDTGAVRVSAIADPKHTADFVEQLFVSVFDRPADYTLWAASV